jgi:hypothetical protein
MRAVGAFVFLLIVLANLLVAASSLEFLRVRQTLSVFTEDKGRPPLASVSLLGMQLGTIEIRADGYMHADGGHAFLVAFEMPALFWSGQDSAERPERSGATLHEDGRVLGPPHARHDRIRHFGMGSYSHWGEPGSSLSVVYLSASDSSSPIENGRLYTAEFPLIIKPWPAAGIAALGLLILLFGLRAVMRALRTLPPFSARAVKSLAHVFALLFAIGLFCGPVLASWSIASGNYLAIGGLLPWSDASGWFTGAIHLLSYGSLDWWTTRRPLNPAFLGTLFLVAGQNLKGLLLLQASLVGVACFLATREIGRTFGVAASLLAFAVLMSFGARFVSTTLSESLGLLFGGTGFALMWRAVLRQEPMVYSFGLFMLTLGLSARPGPLLVLPALALWASFGFSVTARGMNARPFELACLGVLAGGAVTMFLTSIHGSDAGAPGANYSYVLYGLAHGGKQWTQVFIDHPEWSTLTEAALAKLTYRAALTEISENPGNFLSGLWLFGKSYLSNLFSYVSPVLRAPILTLSGIGFAFAVIECRRRIPSFLLAGVLGVVASAPVLFYDADAYRTFVATVPFDAALAALGLAVVIKVLQSAVYRDEGFHYDRAAHGYSGAVALGVLLTFVCTVGLAMAIAAYRTPRFAVTACPSGLSSTIIQLGRTSPYITIRADDVDNESFAPNVGLADFRRDESFANVEIGAILANLSPGTTLIEGWDLSARQEGKLAPRWVVATGNWVLQEGRYYQICGLRKSVRYQGGSVSMMEAEVVREVSPLR